MDSDFTIARIFVFAHRSQSRAVDLLLESGYLCPTPRKGKKSWELPPYRVLRHKIGSIHLEHRTSKIFEKTSSVKTRQDFI
jgi:hypothetical protein